MEPIAVTAPEAAKLLGVSLRKLREMTPQLPHLRTGDKSGCKSDQSKISWQQQPYEDKCTDKPQRLDSETRSNHPGGAERHFSA